MSKVYLLGFPERLAGDICIQLGRIAGNVPVEVQEDFDAARWDVDPGALIVLFDTFRVQGQVGLLFQKAPEANIVVLSSNPDGTRAEQLMEAGVMDYRTLPCPDEAFAIYLRKAGHRFELSKEASRRRAGSDKFVTQDIAIRRLLDKVALIAPSRASVLITGESGTGKERMARFIHQCSDRKQNAFIAVNCAAIPEGMLEAELFGHEKGAFTGATCARPGKFRLAHQGTLLLDEITEMPMQLQAKLLRVLQEGEVDPLGGGRPVKVDVRVVATSNIDVAEAVQKGTFRQDLYYRLNVVSIQIPPLRARKNDILLLADHFLQRFSDMYGKPAPAISEECRRLLLQHPWPGNVRELENCMHRAFLLCTDGELRADQLGLETHVGLTECNQPRITAGMTIRDMEQALIKKTIEHVNGNRAEAAKLLGISIRTLRNKLKLMESGTALAGESKEKHLLHSQGEMG